MNTTPNVNGLPLYSEAKSAAFVKFLMENMTVSKADCEKACEIIKAIEKDYPELKQEEEKEMKKTGIEIVKGDITTFQGDLIINSTNATFSNNGGVSGAIAAAAGREMSVACARYVREHASGPKIKAGDFFVTPGFGLDAKQVLHLVTPKYKEDGVDGIDEIRNVIRYVFDWHKVKSFAMPCLATGHNGYPVGMVVPAVLYILVVLVHDYPGVSVTIYAKDEKDYNFYCEALKRAEGVYQDTPEWSVRVFRRNQGEGRLTKQDKVIVDCRYAGFLGRLNVRSYTNNYPEFKLQTQINGMDMTCGIKQSAMTYAGGIPCYNNVGIDRHMPSGIKFPVDDGQKRLMMDKYQLLEFFGESEKEIWITDPRMMLAGYVALLGEQARINEIVKTLPSRYGAEAILKYYKLLCTASYDYSQPKQFDCYPRMDRIYKDMHKFRDKFVALMLKKSFG